jgi:hypothetical protein
MVKNDAHAYLDCVAHCARGLRCRRSTSHVTARRCALLCAADGQDRILRPRRIWNAILLKGVHHANC